MNANTRQTTSTRGSIIRMMARALTVAALTAATLTATTAASEAAQPAPRCKVLSTAQHLETVGTLGERMAVVVVTTTTSKCRGKIVVTRTSARWLPGPR